MIAAGRRSKTSSTASWICSTGHLLGAEALHEQAHRLGLADRVGDLRLAAVGQAGGDHVLGHPAHRVRGAAVHLGRVLAGERAAAVPGHPAVGVDDDLAAGQPGVAHGPPISNRPVGLTSSRYAGGVDVQAVEHRVDHEVADVGGEQFLQVDVRRVLRGHDHRVQPDRPCRRRTRSSPGSCRPGAGRGPRRAAHLGQPAGPAGARA